MTNKPIFYRKEGHLKRIDLDEVLYIEAADNYVKFHTPKTIHTLRSTLDFIVSRLPENFVKINRSFIVSVDHVDTVTRISVTLKDNPQKEIPVSKRHLRSIIKKIFVIDDANLDDDEIDLAD